MNEKECLAVIASGKYDASDLLNIKLPGIEKRFLKVCRELNAIRTKVQSEFPDACYYTGGEGSLHLMIGSDHNEKTMDAQQELSAVSEFVHIGDGGW